ncbi:MAG: PTS sugar transporter subunit IIA [Gammaproteobacteria bacterium]|nr:PTS sugar transporter subunit IIA [Gammaproteobacteria bacterium]
MTIRLNDILVPQRVVCRPQVSSKKRALELLSERMAAAGSGLTQVEALESLFDRERLGSTGLGHGVAIPHGRIRNLEQPIASFLHLRQGVPYDAVDGRPVALILALLVPDRAVTDHLVLLAQLAEMFNDATLCARLHAANNEADVYSLLTTWQSSAAQPAVQS